MLLNLIYAVLGLIGLYYGGNFLIAGASRIALSLGISRMIIGLTIVAFGTSTPELLVSLSAAFQGLSAIAVGNVVGSNIANIGLILGVTALILPIQVKAEIVRREIPFLIGTTILGLVFMLDGELGRVEGIVMLLGLAFFIWVLFFTGNGSSEDLAGDVPDAVPAGEKRLRQILLIVGGIAMLVVGAQLLVTGSVEIARTLGIPETVIGLTLVAVGTSLPELAASVAAAIRKESDIALGNVIGSNIFNILFILGLTAVIAPIQIAPDAIQFDLFVMMGFAVFMLPIVLNRVLSRREAFVLLAAYALYIGRTFLA